MNGNTYQPWMDARNQTDEEASAETMKEQAPVDARMEDALRQSPEGEPAFVEAPAPDSAAAEPEAGQAMSAGSWGASARVDEVAGDGDDNGVSGGDGELDDGDADGDEESDQDDLDRSQTDDDEGSIRERIMDVFRARLDEALDDEDAPEGVAAGILADMEADKGGDAGDCDLHAIWSAMTAVSQEVKLQSRSFKQLSQALDPIEQLVPAIQTSLDKQEERIEDLRRFHELREKQEKERHAEALRKVEQRAREETLDLLLDMRDRLRRGLKMAELQRDQQKARGTTAGWFERLFRARPATAGLEAVEALRVGVRLGLDRLDEALTAMGVREMACEGARFDPARMRAVDIAATSDAEEGMVLEVYRTGYMRNDQLVRWAEVKVARAPDRKQSEKRDE